MVQQPPVVAEKIRTATERRLVTLDGETFDVSCSIGVAMYPLHASDARTLLRCADDALYRAKKAGKNGVWASGEEVVSSRANQAAST